MVAIIERNKDFKFLTNKEMLEKAKIASKKNGTTLSKALDLFVKQIAVTEEINLLDEKELEHQKWAKELQKRVQEGIKEIEAGQGVSLEEARARFGL
nr:hypothetical protein [Streptococcus agalactiae]